MVLVGIYRIIRNGMFLNKRKEWTVDTGDWNRDEDQWGKVTMKRSGGRVIVWT